MLAVVGGGMRVRAGDDDRVAGNSGLVARIFAHRLAQIARNGRQVTDDHRGLQLTAAKDNRLCLERIDRPLSKSLVIVACYGKTLRRSYLLFRYSDMQAIVRQTSSTWPNQLDRQERNRREHPP